MGTKYPLTFFLMVMFIYTPVTSAEDMVWSVYRSMNQVYDLAIYGTEAWCVTTEGVVKWDTKEPLAKLIYNKFDILYIVRVSFLCTI